MRCWTTRPALTRPIRCRAREGLPGLGAIGIDAGGDAERLPGPESQWCETLDPIPVPFGDVGHDVVAAFEFERERYGLGGEVLDQTSRAEEEGPVAQAEEQGEEVPRAVAAPVLPG